MRYSAKHKAKTRERMLKKAAEKIRRGGVQSTGIARLMGELGMTHGGFYAHFNSKSDLVAEATISLFEDHANMVLSTAEAAPEGHRVRTLVNLYLSKEHRESHDVCPMAGLAGEMARQSAKVRNAYTRAIEQRLRRVAKFLHGEDEDARIERARLLMSGMAGTMMIAKAITDRDASDRFLEQAREFYADAFEVAPRGKK
jgi:TetR/AcrR family transcriptional repressor of nem operon